MTIASIQLRCAQRQRSKNTSAAQYRVQRNRIRRNLQSVINIENQKEKRIICILTVKKQKLF
jgi:hypothetical protein